MRVTSGSRTLSPRASAVAYRRRRLAAAVLVMAAAALMITLLLAVVAPEPSSAGGARVGGVVVVSDGDTIWDLAMERAPDGRDPVGYMAEIVSLNDVRPSALHEGMVLRLPAE